MQSDDQKICLGQELICLFTHSFIHWTNIKSFLYPWSMRQYKLIVKRPVVHCDCAQGTTQVPEDHHSWSPEDKPRSLKAEQALELDFEEWPLFWGWRWEAATPAEGMAAKKWKMSG